MTVNGKRAVALAIWLLVVFLYYITTQARADAGYWDHGQLIAINSTLWIIFLGMTTALGINELVRWIKK